MIKNISNDIDKIIKSLPENLNDIEKARYVYLELGKLFSYDLNILYSDDSCHRRVDYVFENSKPIDRYQTCIQISSVLCSVLNHIGLNASVIDREISNQNFGYNHKAVELILSENEKYILDLTLDLYLIQSGCQTKEFGYSTDIDSNYDIIPLMDLKEIDKKLNVESLTDNKIKEYKKKFDNEDFCLIDKVKIISQEFLCNFIGLHEGKLFIEKIFKDFLTDREYNSCKSYIINRNTENGLEVIPVYIFNTNDINLCYLYNLNSGLVLSTPNSILDLFSYGYRTRSMSLENDLYEMIEYTDLKKR